MRVRRWREKTRTACTARSPSSAAGVASTSSFTMREIVLADDVLATLAALEGDRAVQAVAFFSGKRDNFIAGADIEEFVQLATAADAERLSAHGQELLDRVARFPQPIAAGNHGARLGGGLEVAL